MGIFVDSQTTNELLLTFDRSFLDMVIFFMLQVLFLGQGVVNWAEGLECMFNTLHCHILSYLDLFYS